MLTGQYRRIYYHHLKKSGGSTLNHWLDTLTFDERSLDASHWHQNSDTEMISERAGRPPTPLKGPLAATLFHCGDIVHRHRPLRVYAPENTFCFTVIRHPVQRLVSQVADWRRLMPADTLNNPADVRDCVEDSRGLPLRAFLEKHGQHGGRRFLDNYMTRALAAERVTNTLANVMDPERLCEVALRSLETDYDLVGLTEYLDLSRNALCAMVGLPPARNVPTINATRMAGDRDQDLGDAADILGSLTRVDQVIHDRARQLFELRHREFAEAYDAAMFETHHAGRLLAEARGYACDGATRYSVRAPIIGSGFDGRDGHARSSCVVWTGPETRTTLYIPTPAGMALSILVWIRGYIDSRQRAELRVRIDGQIVAHRFEQARDHADLLAIDTRATRDFVRLEIDIDNTLQADGRGSGRQDSRRRGFAFDSYGWRPIL